jgi:hypothetical protein
MFKKFFNDLTGDEGDNKKKQEEEKLKAQQSAKEDDDDDEEEYEDDEDDDAYFGPEETDEEKQKRILASVNPGVQLHPETLHGLHYTEEQFEAEVEKRLQEKLNDREDDSEYDISDAWRNALRTDVYMEWTGANHELAAQFTWANSLKFQGFSTSANVKEDLSDPLLAPIHGISFYDYSAMCSKLANGAKEEIVLKAFGIDKVIFEELNTMWPKRMQEDNTYTLVALMGQYYADADKHPKLQNLGVTATAAGTNTDNIALIMQEELFYAELAGAREAAYEYGLDGAQWVLENFGIPLGDFQQAAMKHMQSHNVLSNPRKMEALINYQNAFKEQYAAKFAEEQGGNVADDIEF